MPIRKSLGSNKFCLLMQILQLRVRLRSHDLPGLPPLPLPNRIISLQDRRQRIPPSDHILAHVLQPGEGGRDVIHLPGVRRSCPRVCIRVVRCWWGRRLVVVGDRERAGSQVLLLGRGIRIDWTKQKSKFRSKTLPQTETEKGRTGCTLGLFYLGCSGT